MRDSIIRIAVIILLLIFGMGCGDGGRGRSGAGTAEFLKAEIEGSGLIRADEVRTFKGENLYEYIDGGAELYHVYNFKEVSTADYRSAGSEITADIYEFEDSDDAFGLFTSVKPQGPGDIRLGVEGFSTENSIDFVKGRYVIHIIGYDESMETISAIKGLAEKLAVIIPGTREKPSFFRRFPRENMVPGSERIYAESFLGRIFLTDVYSLQYEFGGDDTATLFAADDVAGEKYLEWSEKDSLLKEGSYNPRDFSFDNGYSFAIKDDYRDGIIAGLKNGMLVGIVGYKESHQAFFARWLDSLNQP